MILQPPSFITDNAYFHKKLAIVIKWLMKWHGIGIGAEANTSGEIGICQLLHKLGRNEYTIIDAGANGGQFVTLITRSLKAKQLYIHCFEPSFSAFTQLKTNVQPMRTSWHHIYLKNVGLGEVDEERDFYAPTAGSGMGSLNQRRTEHDGLTFRFQERVSIRRLSQYLRANDIAWIDLLKLDVEGHEMPILKDIEPLFRFGRIKTVCFEFGPAHIDAKTSFQDFFYFFKAYRYRLYRITPTGYLYPITYYTDFLEQYRVSNYVAIQGDIARSLGYDG